MANINYFATEDVQHVISRLDKEVQSWGMDTFASSVFTSVIATYWRNHAAYYSAMIAPDNWASSLGSAGEQGELVKVTLPVARTLTRQFITLVTKQRLNFEVLTENSDSSPMQTARIGKAICTATQDTQELDQKIEAMAEKTCVLGASFMSCTWRSDKGYIYSQGPDGQALYSGDNHVEWHDLLDMVFDWSVENFSDLSWVIVKRKTNRYDLMAQYPQIATDIAALPSVKETRQSLPNYNFLNRYENQDMIYVYEFYHKPSPALPQGRMIAYSSAGTVYYDDINPYECIPVYALQFEKINTTGLGYPMFSNLMPAQEMLDHSVSVQATNQSAYGVQSLLVPRGSDINIEQIVGGVNMIHFSPMSAEGGGEPKPLELPKTPPEVNVFMNDMNTYLGNLSMINDTLRGQPPANVSSGAMAATLSANAMEFLSSAQKNVVMLIEKVMNQVVKNYKMFSSMPQLIDIVGLGNIAYAKEFKEEDIKAISKIKIRTMSPMLNSSAGRIQVADSLLQNGLLKDASKYFQILEGQNLDVLYKDSLSEQMAIQAEVDAILEGKPVMPFILDNHMLFVKSYQELIYNPYVRANGQILQKVLALSQDRINMEMSISMNPALAKIVAALRGVPLESILMPQPVAPEATQPASGNKKQIQTPSEPGETAPGGGKVSKPAQPAQPNQSEAVQQPIGMEGL